MTRYYVSQFSPLFLLKFITKMPYNYQSKVAIHLSNLINPASNKSEGLYKIIMWLGLRRNSWFFSGNTNRTNSFANYGYNLNQLV